MNPNLEKFLSRTFLKNEHVGILQKLTNYIESLIERNDELVNRLKEWNKDDEIQKLQSEIEEIRINSIYVMSNIEKKKAKDFSELHYRTCKGNTSYTLVGNGIGTSIKVQM